MIVPIPVGLIADDAADARDKAMAWAANAPWFASATVVDVRPDPRTSEAWLCVVDVEWMPQPEQEGLGL